MKGLMIFSTSDVFCYQSTFPQGTVVYTGEERGREVKLVSTHKLEAALELGYDCYVTSTRSRLGEHDEWWVKLLRDPSGPRRIFLCDRELTDEEAAAGVQDFEVGMHDLMKHLGFEWPRYGDDEDGRDEGRGLGKPMFWTSALPVLAERNDFRLASAFQGRIELPEKVRSVARDLEMWAHAVVMLVGGAVVDSLQGREPKDYDLEVFGCSLEQVEKVLRERGWDPKPVGRAFGILKLSMAATDGIEVDVSVPRVDNKVGVGHADFEVMFDENMTPEEAARRRDLTFNALLYDIRARRIVDPFGGADDLAAGICRATDPELFVQDPVRALRVMQLSARKAPNVDPGTMALMREMAADDDAWNSLASERIAEEFCKLLMKAEKPSVGLEVLRRSGWLIRFPELNALVGCPQNPEHHPEGDVWTHTLLVVDAMAALCREHDITGNRRKVLMFAALCHDMGKPEALQDDLSCPKHDTLGEGLVRSFLARMTNEKKVVEGVAALSKTHMRPFGLVTGGARDSRWNRLKKDLGQHATLEDAGYLSRADWVGSRPSGVRNIDGHGELDGEVEDHKIAAECWRMFKELEKAEPLVGGRDLIAAGVKPGPQMGELIRAAYAVQLDEPGLSKEELIARVMS